MNYQQIFVLVFVFIQISLFGQDTINKINYVRNGDFVFFEKDVYTGIALEYKDEKIISMESYFEGLANGIWKEWYNNGEKKFIGEFKEGVPNKIWTQWYISGKIQRILTFENGKLVPNKSKNSKESVSE